MFYCGLDLAGVSSFGYVTDGEGRKQWSGWVATEKKALEERLRRFLRGGLTVAIEAGNQTAWIYSPTFHELVVHTCAHNPMGDHISGELVVKLPHFGRRGLEAHDALEQTIHGARFCPGKAGCGLNFRSARAFQGKSGSLPGSRGFQAAPPTVGRYA